MHFITSLYVSCALMLAAHAGPHRHAQPAVAAGSVQREDPIIRVAEPAGDIFQPIDVAHMELTDIEAREKGGSSTGVYCVIA
ncbi:hypothetical protein DFH09DRAFT_1309654 [Mycena vulgaris]|nr:hypothetical protein DFH09DRAFT_1309654 [Mycena vulgaris]